MLFMLIAGFLVLTTINLSTAAPLCPSNVVDLIVLVDASGSVREEFMAQKDLIVDLVGGLPVKEGGTHLGILHFAATAFTDIPLNEGTDHAKALTVLKEMEHLGGSTNVLSGIQMAKEQFATGRPDASKIFLIVSDGHSQNEWRVLDSTCKAMRDSGITILSVTRSTDPSLQELELYTGSREYVFLNSANDVPKLKVELAKATGGDGPCPGPEVSTKKPEVTIAEVGDCNPADFVVILDSSGSVEDDFARLRSFVADMAARLTISPTQHRVALVQFSGIQHEVVFQFDEYGNTNSLVQAIRALPHFQGTTQTGKALDLARTDVLPNSRPGVKTIVVVISDGYSQEPVETAAGKLRDAVGSLVYSVGITEPVNKAELLEISGAEDRTFIGNDLQPLINKLEAFIQCGPEVRTFPPIVQPTEGPVVVPKTKPPPKPIKSDCLPADFFVVLDSSGSVEDDYEVQRKWVQDAINKLTIAPSVHQVGLMQFTGLKQQLEWGFDEHGDKSSLLAAVAGLLHLKGTTQTGKALNLALDILGKHQPKRDLIVVVVTDGFSQDDLSGPAAAIRALPQVTDVYSVGITKPVNISELMTIVGGKEENAIVGSDANLLLQKLAAYVNCGPTIEVVIDPTPEVKTEAPRTISYTLPPINTQAPTTRKPYTTRKPRPTPRATRPPVTRKPLRKGCVLDVLFILDSSGSIFEAQAFREELERAVKIVDRMNIGPNLAQVAMITFAHRGSARTEFPFKDFDNKADVRRRILETKLIGGTTAAGDALDLASKELTVDRGLRRSAQPIVIMFSDGLSQQDVASQARRIQSIATNIFAVSTSRFANPKQLEEITGTIDNVFSVKGSNSLEEFEKTMDNLFSGC